MIVLDRLLTRSLTWGRIFQWGNSSFLSLSNQLMQPHICVSAQENVAGFTRALFSKKSLEIHISITCTQVVLTSRKGLVLIHQRQRRNKIHLTQIHPAIESSYWINSFFLSLSNQSMQPHKNMCITTRKCGKIKITMDESEHKGLIFSAKSEKFVETHFNNMPWDADQPIPL